MARLTSLTLFRHFRNICLVALACLSATVAVGSSFSPAGADPIGDKRAQAAALQDQIEATNLQIDSLGEQYNAAQLALDQAEAQLAQIEAQITTTKAEIAQLKAIVEDRAAAVYRQARSGQSLDEIDYSDAQKMLSRKQYASAQAQHDDAVLNQLDNARKDLGKQRAKAKSARDEAAKQRDDIAATTAKLQAASANLQALYNQVQGEIAQLVAQELARRQAEAQAMARAHFTTDGDGNPNLPPPGPSTVKAIAFAKQQIGKTYVYAAAGPDHFDCSGLVMAAFRSAGVSLPHYSGAQYDALPHVPFSAMQPGDLIFWGPHASVHVAIYLGDLKIIESGGTGHDVHIGPIWGHPTGAARVLK